MYTRNIIDMLHWLSESYDDGFIIIFPQSFYSVKVHAFTDFIIIHFGFSKYTEMSEKAEQGKLIRSTKITVVYKELSRNVTFMDL